LKIYNTDAHSKIKECTSKKGVHFSVPETTGINNTIQWMVGIGQQLELDNL